MGVYEALGFAVLGAVLVIWPLTQRLRIHRLEVALRDEENRVKILRAALAGSEDLVDLERNLDDGRDLPPADELGLLFPSVADGAGEVATGDDPVLSEVED